jgi:hypothetical protein
VSGAGPSASGAAPLTSLQTSQGPVLAANPSQAAGVAGQGSVTLKFEQRGEVFEFPITVKFRYANGGVDETTVLVTDRVVQHTLPLKGVLRSVHINEDDGALVEVVDR